MGGGAARRSTGEAEKATILLGPGRDECGRVLVIKRREEFRFKTLFKDFFFAFCVFFDLKYILF